MPQTRRWRPLQAVKDLIIRQGPDSAAVRLALMAHARLHGFRIRFTGKTIAIRRGMREMVVGLDLYVQIPIMMEAFDLFFGTMYPKAENGLDILDFSGPGLHRYRRSGAEFYFPSIPEDDAMDAYTHGYKPKQGDIVWDAGAHAGASVYDLSLAVGSRGRVYAFEPDEINFGYLEKNIARLGLSNVVTVKKALAGSTGPVQFQMDGTMNAGIRDFLLYKGAGETRSVAAVSLEDACHEFGNCPAYIKMDIEGAEVAVVAGAAAFLHHNPIHFAIESYHPVDGELTCLALDRFFPTIGYTAESSAKFGQMFTWARPPV